MIFIFFETLFTFFAIKNFVFENNIIRDDLWLKKKSVYKCKNKQASYIQPVQ